jgi:hypothetical protein
MGQVGIFPDWSVLFPAVPSRTNSGLAPSLLQDRAPESVAPVTPGAEPAASPADSVDLQSGSPKAQTFECVTYHAQMERVSLAITLQQVRDKLAETQGDGTQAGAVDSNQLTFEFYGEVRSEELAMFRQRTGNVAQGLEGTQKETYMELSRKVAARFQMSLTISGEALSGFTRASENLADGQSPLFDKFLGFGKDLLSSPDKIMDGILKLLGGFFSGQGDFEAAFTKFVNGLLGSGMLPQSSAAQAKDGTSTTGTSSFQLNIQMEFSFEFSARVQVGEAQVQESDPITLDLNGNGIELTSYRNGAHFDITGTGQAATTAFVSGGDAFLALDRNANGVIDSGKELFGDQNGARNGYEELAKLDSNLDGLINKLDKDFAKLVLFKDNGNGRTEPAELVSLSEAGIVELSLNYQSVNMTAAGGNRIGQIASYRRADGSNGLAADTILRFIA